MSYLNIGGGDFQKKHWLNMDYPFKSYKHKRDFSKIDIPHDLMSCEPFPIETSTIDGIYSSHTIEHITLKAARAMLSEAHRVLKPKAYFRICCPDFDLLYKHYMTGNIEFFNNMKGSKVKQQPIIVQFMNQFTECIDYKKAEELFKTLNKRQATSIIEDLPLRKKYRPNDHLSWWNEARFERELEAAGFRNIRRSMPGRSGCKAFRFKGIDTTATNRSIYMECIK